MCRKANITNLMGRREYNLSQIPSYTNMSDFALNANIITRFVKCNGRRRLCQVKRKAKHQIEDLNDEGLKI